MESTTYLCSLEKFTQHTNTVCDLHKVLEVCREEWGDISYRLELAWEEEGVEEEDGGDRGKKQSTP